MLVVVRYVVHLYSVCDADSTFFGPNFELYFDKTDSDHGSLCAYGPTSDVRAEYVFSCFGGPKSGRSLTVINKYSSGIKLCEVKLMGKNGILFCALVLNCTYNCIICSAVLSRKQYITVSYVGHFSFRTYKDTTCHLLFL